LGCGALFERESFINGGNDISIMIVGGGGNREDA
jgi:hypothetical protein